MESRLWLCIHVTSKLTCFANFRRSKKQYFQFAAWPRTLKSHLVDGKNSWYDRPILSTADQTASRPDAFLLCVRHGSCMFELRIYSERRCILSALWKDEDGLFGRCCLVLLLPRRLRRRRSQLQRKIRCYWHPGPLQVFATTSMINKPSART